MKSLSFPLDLGWPVTGFDLQNLAQVTWDFQALIFRGLGAPASSLFGSQQGWKMPESPSPCAMGKPKAARGEAVCRTPKAPDPGLRSRFPTSSVPAECSQ